MVPAVVDAGCFLGGLLLWAGGNYVCRGHDLGQLKNGECVGFQETA